jgi:hypothetical protein
MPIGKRSRAQTIDSINVKKAERGHDWKPIHSLKAKTNGATEGKIDHSGSA